MMHHTSLLKFPISSTGDVITFNYFNGHTVEEVTEEKYEACEVSILQFFRSDRISSVYFVSK